MNKKDRRSSEQKPISVDRRKGQRRKSPGVAAGAPVRREADWDQIDSELKD